MQRVSRLKRELEMLSTEPPPGITCWQTEEQMDKLHARKLPDFMTIFIFYHNHNYNSNQNTLEKNITF